MRIRLPDLFGRFRAAKLQAEDMIPPEELDFVGGQRFKEVGDEFLLYFRNLAGLQPTAKVLDIGCGVGRIARPLTAYLNSTAVYEGIDIVPEGIDWCNKNISTRFPHFNFQVADINNSLYQPNGTYSSTEYSFPYSDNSFDFIFLTSVFTHLLPGEVLHYLEEIQRMLKPGGTLFATFFLLNDESLRQIANGNSAENLIHELEHCKIANLEQPAASVGYAQSFIEKHFGSFNLEIDYPIQFGNWCGREQFLSYQDILVARKGGA